MVARTQSIIGLGTSVSWYVAYQRDAELLAKALGLTQKGSRTLWCYPEQGVRKGAPRQFGTALLEFVFVQWDGRYVWLNMIGPKVPSNLVDINKFLDSLGVKVRGQADVKTNLPI